MSNELDLNKVYQGPSGEYNNPSELAPLNVPVIPAKIVKPAVKEFNYVDKVPPVIKEKSPLLKTARRGLTPTGENPVKNIINQRRVPVRDPIKSPETRNLQYERFGPVVATVEPVIQNLDIDLETNIKP